MRPTLSLQLYAEPFVSAGDYGAFKELVDGRNPVYSAPLLAVRVRRTTRTSTTVRSGRPTCCAGNTGRARRSSSSGSRRAKEASTTARSGSAATSTTSSARREERVPRQAGVLVELLASSFELATRSSDELEARTRIATELTGLASRFGAFVAERHPFALARRARRVRGDRRRARAAGRGRDRRAASRAAARADARLQRARVPPDLPTPRRGRRRDAPRAGARPSCSTRATAFCAARRSKRR